jgi:hypothetical protein
LSSYINNVLPEIVLLNYPYSDFLANPKSVNFT